MSDILTRDDINLTLADETLWVGSIPGHHLLFQLTDCARCGHRRVLFLALQVTDS